MKPKTEMPDKIIKMHCKTIQELSAKLQIMKEALKEALEEVIEMSKYVDNDRELRQYAKEALDRLKELG